MIKCEGIFLDSLDQFSVKYYQGLQAMINLRHHLAAIILKRPRYRNLILKRFLLRLVVSSWDPSFKTRRVFDRLWLFLFFFYFSSDFKVVWTASLQLETCIETFCLHWLLLLPVSLSLAIIHSFIHSFSLWGDTFIANSFSSKRLDY